MRFKGYGSWGRFEWGRYGYKIIVIMSDNQYFAIFSDKKAKLNKLVLN